MGTLTFVFKAVIYDDMLSTMTAAPRDLHNRIEGIQYLRAIAIILTLFHHSISYLLVNPITLIQIVYSRTNFWSGVDLFFVISGFVIMKGFTEALQSNGSFGKTLKQFWIKRFFRILPSAWLWLGIYLLCTQYFNVSAVFGDLAQNLQDSVAAALQYANYYGLQCWGPLKVMHCGPNGIYWSLSLEEQFYLMLPILMFIFRSSLFWVLIASIVGQFFLFRPDWSVGWAFRYDAISWGVLLAILYQKNYFQRLEPKFLKDHKVISAALLILLTAALVYFPPIPNQFDYGTGIVAFVGAIFVYLSFYDYAYLFPFKSINVVLGWLGSRSYSLYLIHVVVFCFTKEIVYRLTPLDYRLNSGDNWLLVVLAIPFLISVAELNYRYVETPFRNLGIRVASKIR
jgi:peptidoglycan/LPS O-acetylase OafA/YrhL